VAKRAAFVTKWDNWPKYRDDFISGYELQQIGDNDFDLFLSQPQFQLVRLQYEDVRLSEIMDWYQNRIPPFGESKEKQKEFPDAFAIAALLGYARRENVNIAVVSTDSDLNGACHSYSKELLYFPSLAALTERMLQPDKRVDEMKAVLQSDADLNFQEMVSAELARSRTW
jgi:PIN domain